MPTNGSQAILTTSFGSAARPGDDTAPRLYSVQSYPPGTTGFDVVDSRGWLRVEVPGGLVKHPGTNKCGYAQFRHG